MKKFLFFASALAGLFLAGSCQREDLAPVEENGVVTFEVSIPQVMTKTVSDDGSAINSLVYDVYYTDASVETAPAADDLTLLYKGQAEVATNGATVISVELMNDKNYVILFWAQRDNTWGFATEGNLLKNGVHFRDSFAANAENIEAFSHVEFLSSKNLAARTKNITLKRPFAQINLGSLLATNFTITPTTSSMVVKNAGASFDLINQVAVGKKDVEFTAATVPGGSLKTDYSPVGMNYIFANGNVEVDYKLNTEAGITVSNTVSNVPVAANYRTNIIGKLFTSEAGYSITLEGWGDAGADMDVITEGLVKNINGDYEISNENGLAYAMNNLMQQEGGNYYLTAPRYDMTGIDVAAIDFTNTDGLNVYGETPVVTRAAVEGTTTGVVIVGLPCFLNSVESGAGAVSISGITIQNDDPAVVPALINEVSAGADVVVADCAVGSSTETKTNISDLIADGSENVLNASDVQDLETLKKALLSGVKEINLTAPLTTTGEVIIELNGKTVVGVDNATASYGLITNKGNLTVVGPGTMKLSATNNREWNAYSSVISNTVGGNLTVDSGVVIEHLGGTDMAYGIDNLTNGKGTSAVTTIKNATVKSNYRAVRQFLNGVEATNELYVKEGAVIEGANKSIWMQDPSKNANTGKLVVEAGAKLYGDVYLFVTAGSTEWPVEVSIAKSALVDAEVLTGNVPAKYDVFEQDGAYIVGPSYVVDGDNVSVLSANGLRAIAEAVNAGVDYFAGKNVVLSTDIDLNNEEWTPIGSASADHGFMGNFDGNGYTIKNLKLTALTPDAEGYVYAGLFGVTEGIDKDNQNYIKDLTIENVTIDTDGHIVAAAIAYPYYTTVENVTVKGNISIKGGDYTAGVLGYTRRCVNAKNLAIAGNANSVVEGRYTVGGVISDIQTNGGLTADYSNFSASGLTIKAINCVGGISGIITNQALDGATVENVTLVCEDNRTGIVTGAMGGWYTLTNVSHKDVVGATRLVGATYDGAYYLGQILEIDGTKAVVYTIEDGVKAVSVEETTLNGKTWQDAMDWAANLGEGWALASMEELNAIYDARFELNNALEADSADNALFWEGDELYIKNGSVYYANYMSSTEVPYGESDANGNAYFANRVFFKQFNAKGYSDVLYSAFDCINKYAPLKDNYFARATILVRK